MTIDIAHHIFGSIKGYQTLFKSTNVTDIEDAELESFSFGQTNDSDYIKSLNDNPAYLVKKLKSGRWAITRIFKGPNDEYGRTTLLFHSVIIDQNTWINLLSCDVQPLLFHPTLWKNREQSMASVKLDESPIPKEIKVKADAIISKLVNTNHTLIIDESLCSLQIIRWVNRLLPSKIKNNFTCGYRVLSEGMEMSLLCLSRSASRGAKLNSGPISHQIPTQSVSHIKRKKSRYEYENYSIGKDQTRAKNAAIIICIVVAFGILISLVAFLMLLNINSKNKINEISTRTNKFLEEVKQISPLDFKERNKKLKEATLIIEQIKDFLQKKQNEELGNLREALSNWKDKASKDGQIYDKVNKLSEKFQNIISKEKDFYPYRNDLEKANSINKELFGLLASGNDGNDEVNQEIEESLGEIKVWKSKLRNYLIPIRNNIANIREEILSNDPNNINYPDLKQNEYANPKQISVKVSSRLEKLCGLKKEIVNIKKDKSLINAKESPLKKHKRNAEIYSNVLNEYEITIKNYINRLIELKEFAGDLKEIEDSLSANKTDKIHVFKKALPKYEKHKKPNLTGINESLSIHCKHAISAYYENNINDNIPINCVPNIDKKYDKNKIERLYNCIKNSSVFLLENEIFETLREAYENCQKQNNKSK